MSQLDEVLALAANNTAGEFSLSGNSLAVLFYALDFTQNLDNWRDFADEQLSAADLDAIQALVDGATDELMRPIAMIPVGATMTWHTATPPPGWLLCDGSAVYIADYPELFAVWGYQYGGTGTQFGLLDMSDYSPMGAGGNVLLDDTAGNLTHTLTAAEMPVHSHTVTDPGHTHGERGGNGANAFIAGGGANVTIGTGVNGNATRITTNSATSDVTIASAGGGLPHSILHPVKGVHWIVYTGG